MPTPYTTEELTTMVVDNLEYHSDKKKILIEIIIVIINAVIAWFTEHELDNCFGKSSLMNPNFMQRLTLKKRIRKIAYDNARLLRKHDYEIGENDISAINNAILKTGKQLDNVRADLFIAKMRMK